MGKIQNHNESLLNFLKWHSVESTPSLDITQMTCQQVLPAVLGMHLVLPLLTKGHICNVDRNTYQKECLLYCIVTNLVFEVLCQCWKNNRAYYFCVLVLASMQLELWQFWEFVCNLALLAVKVHFLLLYKFHGQIWKRFLNLAGN